jgi:outer membrane protein OmpA-like peptidoglycan-associated protein
MLSRKILSGFVFAATIALTGFSAQAHWLSNDHRAVFDNRGNVVRTTSGHCLLSNAMGGTGECLGTERVIALEDRTVYFAFNDSSLTPEAKAKLDSLAGILKSSKSVQSVSIVGYADRIGSHSYNEVLSKKRATTVRDYLVAQGLINVNVAKTKWVGKTKPSVKCDGAKSAGVISCLAPDRKVEVEVNYTQTQKKMPKKAVTK